ncbi:hypothetical protein ACIQ34_11005 [Ureibacillus sp. NPDC094379]
MQHKHPTVYINQIEYEGYCYYAKNTNDNLVLIAITGIETNLVQALMTETEVGYSFRDVD